MRGHSPFHGIYTLPDAAHILGLPLPKLRRWLDADACCDGRVREETTTYGLSVTGIEGTGADKHVDFLSLIELFTIYQLRNVGVRFSEIRAARRELADEFETEYPFALKGLLSDGQKIARELSHTDYLILNDQGQRGFGAILKEFFARIDFEQASQLARRYYPCGKDSAVVVDPRISFGRPAIGGTAITTEALVSLHRGGETVELIAAQFEISEGAVHDALRFEGKYAA